MSLYHTGMQGEITTQLKGILILSGYKWILMPSLKGPIPCVLSDKLKMQNES